MIYLIKEIGLSLEIENELLNNLLEIGKKCYPKEFGGFLIGYYNEEMIHLHITDTILPKKYQSSKFSFERSTTGIENELIEYYESEPRKIYVGEWHTHPDNKAIPSSRDISAINEIINNGDAKLPNPVLLIIGYSADSADFEFYVFYNKKLHKYEPC